ncbi:class I SAM-dependent methyltransferase [Candidatus Woesearchaeota archaeon]|nr:class I SAM-dependent methyltransferase [Candidatus Woesearchaeota archaeon]
MEQEKIFLQGEADNWFRRNLHAKPKDKDDLALMLLDLYGIKPKKLLEIGCSNGHRLHVCRKLYDAECFGVEPGAEAVKYANENFKDITVKRGVMSNIPFDGPFDVVIVFFVMHWIDRDLLIKSMAEADRVLANGGHLILGDFYPDAPSRNKYHHLPNLDVFTFKDDYARMFTQTPNYQYIAHLSTDFEKMLPLQSVAESDRRVVANLLRKNE